MSLCLQASVGSAPRRAPSHDLERFVEKRIRVKFAGGREIVGVLKGFDPLVNLVLDDTVEYLRGRLCVLGAREGSAIRRSWGRRALRVENHTQRV